MIKFRSFGHPNLLGTHKTTFEFTKEDFLTKKGDCIIGINADFNLSKSDLTGLKKIKINLGTGVKSDQVIAYYYSGFVDPKSMVIRKSDFKDYRTFAIKSNKASIDINRGLIHGLNSEKSKIEVSIEPVKIKALIFDFDNTIEGWTLTQKSADHKISKIVFEKYNINEDEFLGYFKARSHYYIGRFNLPKYYGRDIWLKDTFDHFKIKISPKEIDHLVKIYWDECTSKAYLFPNVIETLMAIKLKKAILSDSDGKLSFKMDRIKKTGVDKYFDEIVISDMVGVNKPDKKCFLYTAEKLGVLPEECIMVGDHPETDLITAKKLGMTTILIKNSNWYKKVNYADHEIDDVSEILGIINELNG